MDVNLLTECNCFFGGGTAISLLLGEFRTSIYVDFLCSDRAGYSKLREKIFDHGIGGLFNPGKGPVLLRHVRSDRDGIRAVIV